MEVLRRMRNPDGRLIGPRRLLARSTLGGALVLAVLVSAGCEQEDPPPPSDPELRAELGIPDGTPIHRVDLGGPGPTVRIIPRFLDVRPGDVVQFVVLDHQPHLLRFLEEDLGPPLLEFLRGTSQDRPPPLVDEGARLVLSFAGAPPGDYVFLIEGNGSSLGGRIRVLAP